MILLAIDTSSSGCFAAIHDSDSNVTLGFAGEDIGRGHAERLMAFVDAALDSAGVELSAIERIAVTIGPGSFTGIRVGVAAARGLSLALGVPAVGVSTLAAIAADSDAGEALAKEIIGVTRDGEKCETFSDCAQLLEEGTDIDYDGISGPIDMNETGSPSAASIGIFRYEANNKPVNVDYLAGEI